MNDLLIQPDHDNPVEHQDDGGVQQHENTGNSANPDIIKKKSDISGKKHKNHIQRSLKVSFQLAVKL